LTAQLYLLVSDRPPIAVERKLGSIVLWGSLVVLGFIGLFFITGTPSAVFDHYLNFLTLNFGCAVPIAGVIFCVSRYDSAVSRLLSVRRLVGLGEISYSIYAVHTWTLRAFLRPPVAFDLANGLESLVRIPVAMIFTVIMATATYRVIEMPSRRILRERLTRLFDAWLQLRSRKVLSAAPASQ
jgi:peptidoglycan/LPS O-acetylase OafA/YrhL